LHALQLLLHMLHVCLLDVVIRLLQEGRHKEQEHFFRRELGLGTEKLGAIHSQMIHQLLVRMMNRQIPTRSLACQ
jgi:hypothetical protein